MKHEGVARFSISLNQDPLRQPGERTEQEGCDNGSLAVADIIRDQIGRAPAKAGQETGTTATRRDRPD